MDLDFDLDALVAPLPDPAVGADLREAGGGLFFRLKDLRSDARTAEREAVASPDQETPVVEVSRRVWAELAELAAGALRENSKDLEIAAWLCEAWTRVAGFPGLNAGLELLQRLIDGYWDIGLYPRADEDGVATRIAPIGNLLGLEGVATLLQPVRLLPLSDTARDVALWTVETAFASIQGSDAGARERLQAKRTEQIEAIRQGLVRSSPEFLRSVHRDVREAVTRIEALTLSLGVRANVDRFGSQVIQPLNAIAELLESQVADKLVDPTAIDTGAAPEADIAGALTPPATGEVANREQAYAAILKIADFFETSEPQSLLAQSLRESVRRARLPLDILLVELIPDPVQRTLFLQRAGVKDPNGASENNAYN